MFRKNAKITFISDGQPIRIVEIDDYGNWINMSYLADNPEPHPHTAEPIQDEVR